MSRWIGLLRVRGFLAVILCGGLFAFNHHLLTVGAIGDPARPLLEMLAFIPDTHMMRYGVDGPDDIESVGMWPVLEFVSYTALEQSNPAGIVPANYADFICGLRGQDHART